MRKISLYILMAALATGTGATAARAQDAATQQQIDKLSGQLQDIIDAEAAQSKRMGQLEHDLADLRDKVNTPAANNYASSDDLQKLATQMQDLDKKRLDDRELILGKIGELAKISATAPIPHGHHQAVADPDQGTTDPTTTPDATTKQKGWPYKVQPGNSLSAIIKAFREKGVKVTLTQVLKANPGLTANNLEAGQTIFIPDPSAK